MIRLEEFLEVKDGVCELRPQGQASLVEAVDLVRAGIDHCRRQSIVKLFFDAKGLVGIPIPTLVDRFLAVEEWAHAAKGMVIVVLVIHPEYIHPEKFGVRVAEHLGLTSNVFSDEAQARKWLAGFAT
jgi:hypothetical protein